MNNLRLILSCLGVASGFAAQAQNQNEILIEHLNPQSEIEHNLEKGVAIGSNGVVVKYGTNAVLVADQVILQQDTGMVSAQGNVILQHGGQMWRGDVLQYNFLTEEMSAGPFRAGMAPFYIAGQSLSASQTNQTYVTTEAYVTTDDIAEPSYRVRTRRLKIIPGQKLEAEKATVYLGSVPVMHFPFVYSRRLDHRPNHFTLTPGYRSTFGPFLLTSYNWMWSTNLSGAINLDYRLKRGPGVGPDFHYDAGRWGKGTATAYYTHDEDPGTDINNNPITEERYRIKFSHQAMIRTNLSVTALVNKQSDPLIIRDFFEPEYDKDPQPKTFLEATQIWPNFTLDFLAQPQLNDFFQTVERLPDVKLSALRQQLGASPFFYEGENSIGYFRFSPATGSVTNSYEAMRADSFHQILLPLTYFGWLNIVPRVGGRFTYYSETHGENVNLEEEARGVFNTGAEVSFKASRVWNGVRSKFWDVKGIRHIVQPSVNYVYVPRPNVVPRELPQFDTELPSLRLLPIDFPDYNSIDSIDSQNVLRLTLRNKVQTKRKDQIENLVNWALYTDWRLDPRPGQNTFADAFSDLDFKPRSWLTLSSEIRYNIDDFRLRLANHTATIAPNDVWSLAVGHFYLDDPAFGPNSENNLIHTSFYYRLNENWGVRFTHYYEARDGVLEDQYYTIYRDLRSWTSALTFRVRDQRSGPTDFTVAVTFSLKAFPRFGLGKDRSEHSVLLGG